jgi:hypothetical protein
MRSKVLSVFSWALVVALPSCSGNDQLSPPDRSDDIESASGGVATAGGQPGAGGSGIGTGTGGAVATGGAPTGAGGAVGSGGSSDVPVQTISCGTASCAGVPVPAPFSVAIDPCCATAAACGLDMTILKAYQIDFGAGVCQERGQPGVASAACTPSAPVKSPVPGFKDVQSQGCCRRATSTCGYLLDTMHAEVDGTSPGFTSFDIALDLGCVDAAPFDEASGQSTEPRPCTPQ